MSPDVSETRLVDQHAHAPCLPCVSSVWLRKQLKGTAWLKKGNVQCRRVRRVTHCETDVCDLG